MEKMENKILRLLAEDFGKAQRRLFVRCRQVFLYAQKHRLPIEFVSSEELFRVHRVGPYTATLSTGTRGVTVHYGRVIFVGVSPRGGFTIAES